MLNNALKTASKNTIQKQEKITGDLFDSEIAHKITKNYHKILQIQFKVKQEFQ